MSNQIQIDLSKAYAGQIAHLKNGAEQVIKSIKQEGEVFTLTMPYFTLQYNKDGTFISGIDAPFPEIFDISYLENDYYIEAARIEGMIEAYESILQFNAEKVTFDFALEKRAELKTQLKALQDGNN